MQSHHADPGEAGCGGDGSCDRIRDIVKLQVEEDVESEARKPLNRLRAFGCE